MLAAVFDIPRRHRAGDLDAREDGADLERLRAGEGRRQVLRRREGNQGDARRLRRLSMATGEPMKIRRPLVGDSTEVKVLMSHEMETGQRKDAQGQIIPAWFIQNVIVTWNGKTVLSAQWGTAISKNPFLSFKFKGGAKGDKIAITWIDNRGDKRTDEAIDRLTAFARSRRATRNLLFLQAREPT